MSTQEIRPASAGVVIAAPMSFTGSLQRIWKLASHRTSTPAKIGMGTLAVTLIAMAWAMVLSWYCIFGVLVVPYRMVRRSQRKGHRENLRQTELLQAMAANQIARQGDED